MAPRNKISGIFATLSLAVCMLVAGFAGPVRAQPADSGKPRIYVFSFVKGEEVSDVVFNKIQQYFLTLFKMSAKLTVVTDEDLKSQVAKEETAIKREKARTMAPWLEKADNLLWQGKDLMVKKSYPDAIQTLTEAKELYEKHYLELRDYDKLVDVTTQLAISFFLAGYADNGEELLRDVLVWRPDFYVEKKKYPKSFVASLERMRGMMEKRKGGPLRVEVSPAEGSKVFVDGVLKGTLTGGKTGVDVNGLYRGRHYVQVFRAGHEIWAKRIGVKAAGRSTKVVAELKQTQSTGPAIAGDIEGDAFKVYQYALTGDFTPQFSKEATQFAQQAQVPYMLYGFVSKEARGTKLTLFLFKGAWSALAEVEPVAFDDNLTNLQVNLLFLEANLASALQTFPKSRVVRGVPAVYKRSRELAAKKAEPVVVPAPVVVKREEPRHEPAPVVVVKPEPRTEPVNPAVARTEPVRPVRTQPREEEDLGELSSIFSSGGGSRIPTETKKEENTYVAPVNEGIPLGPGDDIEKKDDDDDALVGKWWFWAAVAGGVAVVGGGSYLLVDGVSGGGEAGSYSATTYW